MNTLTKELVNLIALDLPDRELCDFRAVGRFFRQHAAPAKFLCRGKIRRFRLIPSILIDRILQPQTPEDLQTFINLLPSIKSELTDVMAHSPHAEWILYALLDKTTKLKECLGNAIATTTDGNGNFVYHYFALAGHWDSFTQYAPNFRYDGSENCKAIACKVITGGHLSFYQNLVTHYGFPDYNTDPIIARALVLPAIKSGNLVNVELLVSKLGGQLLTVDHLLEAIRLGHTPIYEFLINGTLLPETIYNAEMAEEILSHAALFDNLDLVKYFLEDQTAQEKWHFTLETLPLKDSLRDRALQGGSKKVLKYLHDKNPDLLTPKELFIEFPALFIAASHKQLDMCRHLITEYKLDPLYRTDEGECCLHYVEDFDCYKWFVDNYYSDDKLPLSNTNETPLDTAGKKGNYWLLQQASNEFDVNVLLTQTVIQRPA